jgi:hypothetical protein
MKLPRFTLRDLLWLTLVIGLTLTIFIRERQSIAIHRERIEYMDGGWRWSFDTLAKEHEEKTGMRCAGMPFRVFVERPDGTIAQRYYHRDSWEIKP